MTEEKFTCKQLFIFVIRHGLARIIMSLLLIICYARAICEKKQLWILDRFCYVGLIYLIVDWWIILLKVHVYRQLTEYFWINTGIAIFIIFTMPPLWFLRYAYFVQAVKDSKLEAKIASNNLESYVEECWILKDRRSLENVQMRFSSADEMIPILNDQQQRCSKTKKKMQNDWCAVGICWLEQMPDEMLEQVIVMSTICLRWMITGYLGLDQLITYFIATASDIVDFASTMVGQSDELIQIENKNLMKSIIAAYFISLSQFCVNLAGKRRHDHTCDNIIWSRASFRQRISIMIDFLFGTEVWGIIAQVATEDGLLLGLRFVVIIKFDASTLENLFFVVKNLLTITIFTYYAAAIFDSYVRHRYRYQRDSRRKRSSIQTHTA